LEGASSLGRAFFLFFDLATAPLSTSLREASLRRDGRTVVISGAPENV
jgi:hypothetical protein